MDTPGIMPIELVCNHWQEETLSDLLNRGAISTRTFKRLDAVGIKTRYQIHKAVAFHGLVRYGSGQLYSYIRGFGHKSCQEVLDLITGKSNGLCHECHIEYLQNLK